MVPNVPIASDSPDHRHADDTQPGIQTHVWLSAGSRRPAVVVVQIEYDGAYTRAELTPAAARSLGTKLLEAAARANGGQR